MPVVPGVYTGSDVFMNVSASDRSHHRMRIQFLCCVAVAMVCHVCGCQVEPAKKTTDLYAGECEKLKASNAYLVCGCVIKQGQYQLPSNGSLTVSQAILRARGFSNHAKGGKVMIVRRAAGRPILIIQLHVESILRDSRWKKDPQIFPGDVILVEEKFGVF